MQIADILFQNHYTKSLLQFTTHTHIQENNDYETTSSICWETNKIYCCYRELEFLKHTHVTSGRV